MWVGAGREVGRQAGSLVGGDRQAVRQAGSPHVGGGMWVGCTGRQACGGTCGGCAAEHDRQKKK